MTIRALASRLVYSETALATSVGYKFALKRRYGVSRPLGYPQAPWRNAVLKTRTEWETATAQVRALGLPPYNTAPKNWDGLAALAATLQATQPTAAVLDAGAALGSMILPWLFLYGYRNLIGVNLQFDRTVKRGPIRYEHGDITRSRFAANTFEVVVCQSVLEHGVDVRAYLQEMARLLRPGGLLITSVDYYAEPVMASGFTADGLPYRIFTKADVGQFLSIAASLDLIATDPLDLECQDCAVKWEQYGLEYTFLILTLRKEQGKPLRQAGPQ